jgi:uncharacterized protein (TIGR02217 family)
MASSYLDIYLPDDVLGLPCQVGPRFSTRITLAKSGDESRNQNWANPLRRVQLPEAICDQTAFEGALDHWLIMGGPYSTFPFRDPFDFASVALEEANEPPVTTGLDQPLGTGDGLTRTFQMIKRRTLGGVNYDRPIYLPVLDTIDILIDGVAPSAASGGPYTLSGPTRPGGVCTFTPAPTAGRVLTWGGLFDIEVRWEADDTFDANMHSMDTSGAMPINLVEVRRC